MVGKKQVKVRFAEIDTPEKKQPWGQKAKQALTSKVMHKIAKVTCYTIDRYGRCVGKVEIENRNINKELIDEGHAWVYRQYLKDKNLLNSEKSREKGEKVYGVCLKANELLLGYGEKNRGCINETVQYRNYQQSK